MRVLISTACVNNRVGLGGLWRGRKQGDWLEKGSMGPNLYVSLPLSLSLFFSPLPSSPEPGVVHFLLSKIMTMLIFLTREEFFKLTCNQTGPRVFRWAGGREGGVEGDDEGSKSSTYEPRFHRESFL